MKHPVTGEKAVAQVKHGEVDLNRNKYRDLECKTFLLTTKGSYTGTEVPHVHCLDPDTILSFAKENYQLMPDRIQNWINFENEIST